MHWVEKPEYKTLELNEANGPLFPPGIWLFLLFQSHDKTRHPRSGVQYGRAPVNRPWQIWISSWERRRGCFEVLKSKVEDLHEKLQFCTCARACVGWERGRGCFEVLKSKVKDLHEKLQFCVCARARACVCVWGVLKSKTKVFHDNTKIRKILPPGQSKLEDFRGMSGSSQYVPLSCCWDYNY